MADRRLYFVQPDESASSPVVNAAYRLGLPGITCPTCGDTWAAIGIHYPSVRIRRPRLRAQLATPRALLASEWRPLQASLRREVGNLFLPPGTTFGPLVGIVAALPRAFVWPNPWTLLAPTTVASRLRPLGISSVALRVRTRRSSPPFRELVLPHVARLRHASPLACRACRRSSTPWPALLSQANIVLPRGVHLARIRQWPTIIVASRKFASLAEASGWPGLSLQQATAT